MQKKSNHLKKIARNIEEVKKKEVTYYFIDMINVCINYEFVPPNFLFNMAKAFVCLNGISNFSDNKCTAIELLQEQTIEFLVKRSLKDCKGIVIDSLRFAPQALKNISQYGLVNTISKVTTNSEIKKDVRKSLEDLKEMVDLIKLYCCDEIPVQIEQSQQSDKYL